MKDIQLGIYALGLLMGGISIEEGEITGVMAEKLAILSLRYKEHEFSVSFTKDDLEYFTDIIIEISNKIPNKMMV